MVLLTLDQITKSYTEKKLLNQISFTLNEGDKVGVIGINGTGKSTLLKIVAGIEQPDQGKVVKSNSVRIGYLPQNPVFTPGNTVLEQVLDGISNQLDTKEYEAKAMLQKLGIADDTQLVDELSGGQKKRVAIAAALLHPCEVLVMDEPTNHLDHKMVTWLEEYLKKYRGALLMVTHDRYFLDRVTNQILEIDRGSIYQYETNYSGFVQRKAEREEMEAASERKRRSLLKKELAWMQQGPKARGTKSRYRIERYEELSSQQGNLPEQQLELNSLASRLGKKIVELENISKSYDGQLYINQFSYNLLRNSRIGIVGPNGCGKSTLLKIICGKIQPDSGIVHIGETVKFGYFSQECDEMDLSMRVIDYIKEVAERIQTPDGVLTASQLLEKFLFSGDLQWNTIGRLSGGERRRLFLCRILMNAPNVLLLDEPTNDLDIQTMVVLEDYLECFDGAVIAVSHDRYFLDKMADFIFAYQPGGIIRQYVGGYTDYEQQINSEELSSKPVQSNGKSVKNIRPKKQDMPKTKFSYKEQYDYDHIDGEIEALEQKLAEVAHLIEEQSSDYSKLQELLEEQEQLNEKLEEKTERWIYLNELAEQIENAKKS
ncbi:ABC-F family ATP-binding cassette domain-containing protein [Clostridium facile]|uniref:ABC-F family ATP-binding cassette domain-containing protein n=1 Tax=Clostridium facile TaxID=2763035 RepID=A0ABR7IR72_9CLOT|nr:ABC-F family ATP-binding cassette domain-containing protein [Clostridium facile]MBC5787644.1 ABC-F family ATP-binding cassette domain-containing protein [Clostridium facile]